MTAHQDPTANPTGDPSLDKSAEQGAAQGSSDATAHAEAQPLDPIAQLQAELVTAQAQLSEHKDQVLRAHASHEERLCWGPRAWTSQQWFRPGSWCQFQGSGRHIHLRRRQSARL